MGLQCNRVTRVAPTATRVAATATQCATWRRDGAAGAAPAAGSVLVNPLATWHTVYAAGRLDDDAKGVLKQSLRDGVRAWKSVLASTF